MKGRVTILPPSTTAADQLNVDDKVLEDSSVVTNKGAFVRIKMSDGSTLTVKPNSKVVVRSFQKKKIGMVKLIKGVVRTKVHKALNRKKKNKFIVKTRSAVMGVRGTEFVTSFHPQSQKTTLLTIEGEVAMKKAQKSDLITGAKPETPDFNKSNSQVISRGQLTQAMPEKRSLAKPVKLAPQQFASVRVNDDFKPEVKKEELLKEIEKVEGEYAEDAKAGENFATQDSGGVVDFYQGEYLKPNQKAKFNEKLKIYEADENLIKKVNPKGEFQATLSKSANEATTERYNDTVNEQYQKYFGD
ncbi:FecR family protein [Bacteriovoracaceae bacterium]|nr:FecR family protein [Bacteriovoracaceae bacterium]